jgi:hypothetical protein
MSATQPIPFPTPAAPDPAGGSRLSTELRRLGERFGDRPVRCRDIVEATQGRGYHFLLLCIALPFVGPVPLPGFSIPFGFVVTLLGTRLALDKKPWLPEALLEREIPPRTAPQLLVGASRMMEGLEYVLRPRWGFVPNHAVFGRVAGFLIALSGLMLMLPLPLPFSNSLPAWTVILLAAGALGRDGVFFFAGCGSFLLSAAFFTLLWFSGGELLRILGWAPGP